MSLRVLAAVAGVLGGACWIARWIGGSGASWVDSVYWAGLGLLGVAFAGVGANLVSKGALWLRAIVAIAFPLLVWSVYTVVNSDGESLLVDGVVGVAAVLGAVVILLRARSARQSERRPRAGSHAA